MTHFGPFAPDKSFMIYFWILLVVLDKTYLEEMAQNGFTNFCILETNTFILKKNVPQHILYLLYLHSKGQVFIIQC